ncbi:MAG: DNA-binding response regulator [Balneolaceae bacterium]|nr:MAG: DNA-binding response regulator [Balneolaceae bacterium]
MGQDIENIAIVSTQKVRASIIEELIKNSFGVDVNTFVIDPDDVLSITKLKERFLIILDLMGVDAPAKKIINELKNLHSDAAIIALHMYRSANLVKPLFEFGVNGYVYYEPTKDELNEAIRKVVRGDRYVPSYLLAK